MADPRNAKYLRKTRHGYSIVVQQLVSIPVCTHDPELALYFCESVLLLRRVGGRHMPKSWWRAVRPALTWASSLGRETWDRTCEKLKRELAPTTVLNRWMQEVMYAPQD